MRPLLAALALALAGALPWADPLWAKSAPAETPPAVTLKSVAVIEGDVVRLGDLFHGLGAEAETAVARAPSPGARVELSSRWLAALALGHGVPWRPSSALDRVLVERASHTIGSAQVEDVILSALAERGVDGRVALLLDNPGLRLQLPAEIEPSLAITGLSYDPGNGRFNARIVAPATGAPHALTSVTGRAVVMTDVPVLQRPVEPGETIRPEDVGWTRLRADRIGRNVVLDAQSVIGKSPRRPIGLDQPIRSGDLREPVTVKKNSLVTISLRTERMVLTAQGRALEDGATGNVIRVMNTKSNTVINAVVAESGLVEVQPAGGAASN